MTAPNITTPDIRGLLAPLLPSLPAAALSTTPATGSLPLLSPILRQRVKLFSASSTDPWIKLLTYDTAKAAKLPAAVRNERLEPHPVSGEVEIDWDYDVQTQYRRLDKETLQALVVLEDLELFFRLVYCVGDQEGGGDGWRIGEVSIPDKPSPFASFEGKSSIEEAERAFRGEAAKPTTNGTDHTNGAHAHHAEAMDEDEDDDDDYWARYDATPARTPAVKRSPAPMSTQTSQANAHHSTSAEDAYFAQYDSVQPAMDNHDPDEEANAADVAPPLGLVQPVASNTSSGPEKVEEADLNETTESWTLAPSPGARSHEDEERTASLAHPRPASSASSNGSVTIAKFEEHAAKREQSEFGIKQHVSRSIRSLFLLSRAAGIDREEFESLVKAELDILGMVEHDI